MSARPRLPARTPPDELAVVARGPAAAGRGGAGHRGHRVRLAAPSDHHDRRPARGAAGRGPVERLLRPGAERRRPGRPRVLGRPQVRRRLPAAPGLSGLRARLQRPHPLAPLAGAGAGPGAGGRPAPAGRRAHPRPGPLVPGRDGHQRQRRRRGGPPVLAPPALQQRPDLDRDDPAGCGPQPHVGSPAQPERTAGRGHPPAHHPQPVVQPEGRAVPAGRPDAVRLRAHHGRARLGRLPVQPARPAPGGPQPDLPDHQRPGAGAGPRRAGAGRQPGRRAPGRPAPGRGRRPAGDRPAADLERGGDRRRARRGPGGHPRRPHLRPGHLGPPRAPAPARRPPGRGQGRHRAPSGRGAALRRPQPRAGGHRPPGRGPGARAGRGRAPAGPGRAEERLPPGRLPRPADPAGLGARHLPDPPAQPRPPPRGRDRRPARPPGRQRQEARPDPHRPARPGPPGPGHRRAPPGAGRPGRAGRRGGLRGRRGTAGGPPGQPGAGPGPGPGRRGQGRADHREPAGQRRPPHRPGHPHLGPGRPRRPGRPAVRGRRRSRDPGRAARVDLPAVQPRPGRRHLRPRVRGRPGPGGPAGQPPRRPRLGRGPGRRRSLVPGPAPRRMRALRSYLLRLVGVARTVSGNPGLLRAELAYVAFNMTEWATWVSILAYAYQVGGAPATGLAAGVQLVPAALVAPLASIAGDRYRRERVLLGGYVAQAASMAATAAALLAGAPVPPVYGLAALTATSITITRPAQGALLPTLARTPDELTAANVASSWTESFSVLAGPALAALLLQVSGPGAVFAVMAAALACSGLLVTGIETGREPVAAVAAARRGAAGAVLATAFGGFRALARERLPRLSVGLLTVQYLMIGTLDVLLVVLAFEVLDLGSSGVGLLNSAVGAGAIAGSALTVLLVGRRLVVPMVVGFACWGLALGAIALVPSE